MSRYRAANMVAGACGTALAVLMLAVGAPEWLVIGALAVGIGAGFLLFGGVVMTLLDVDPDRYRHPLPDAIAPPPPPFRVVIDDEVPEGEVHAVVFDWMGRRRVVGKVVNIGVNDGPQ